MDKRDFLLHFLIYALWKVEWPRLEEHAKRHEVIRRGGIVLWFIDHVQFHKLIRFRRQQLESKTGVRGHATTRTHFAH